MLAIPKRVIRHRQEVALVFGSHAEALTARAAWLEAGVPSRISFAGPKDTCLVMKRIYADMDTRKQVA